MNNNNIVVVVVVTIIIKLNSNIIKCFYIQLYILNRKAFQRGSDVTFSHTCVSIEDLRDRTAFYFGFSVETLVLGSPEQNKVEHMTLRGRVHSITNLAYIVTVLPLPNRTRVYKMTSVSSFLILCTNQP